VGSYIAAVETSEGAFLAASDARRRETAEAAPDTPTALGGEDLS
jgi:hypothetical protein